MSKAELDNLVGIGKLNAEPASRTEFEGMVSSARKRLVDAQNEDLEIDSQFDLAYGAAHRFAHERNLAEYEGRTEIDAQLLADLIRCTKKLAAAVGKLPR